MSVMQLPEQIPLHTTVHSKSPTNGLPCDCGQWQLRGLCGHLFERWYPKQCGNTQTETGAPDFCPGKNIQRTIPLLRVNIRCRACRFAERFELADARWRTAQLARLGYREEVDLHSAGLGSAGESEDDYDDDDYDNDDDDGGGGGDDDEEASPSRPRGSVTGGAPS